MLVLYIFFSYKKSIMAIIRPAPCILKKECVKRIFKMCPDYVVYNVISRLKIRKKLKKILKFRIVKNIFRILKLCLNFIFNNFNFENCAFSNFNEGEIIHFKILSPVLIVSIQFIFLSFFVHV